jgi:cytochrome c oxidase subunit IV
MKPWHLPSALLWALLALLALLALTTALAYQRLGALNTPIALAIATTKALVVAAIFMELRERRPLTIAFAAAGFFWLAILMWLAGTDFTTRPGFPPRPPPRSSVGVLTLPLQRAASAWEPTLQIEISLTRARRLS